MRLYTVFAASLDMQTIEHRLTKTIICSSFCSYLSHFSLILESTKDASATATNLSAVAVSDLFI